MRGYELSSTEKTIGFSKAVRAGQTGVFSVAHARLFSRERNENGCVGGKTARQKRTTESDQTACSGSVPLNEGRNQGDVSYRRLTQDQRKVRVFRDENRFAYPNQKNQSLKFPNFKEFVISTKFHNPF